MSLSEVLDEVQRHTHCDYDQAVYAAALAWPHVLDVRGEDERHRLLLQFILAGSEPSPWMAA